VAKDQTIFFGKLPLAKLLFQEGTTAGILLMYRRKVEKSACYGMAKTSSHRLVFTKDRSLSLGDALPSGTRDDAGVRLPIGGRCMVDSIYHNEGAGQFVVTVSHYPEVKVAA
jgi:hypothetical protein